MSTAFQGFDIKLNLIESSNDELAINNLAGAPIGADLVRFVNNMRNESVITVLAENISGSTITIEGSKFVYTNGTIITVNGTPRRVGDSNGVDSFRIYNVDTNSLITSPPEGLYIRSDAVTFENVNKLSQKRERVVEDQSASVFRLPSTADLDFDIYSSLLTAYGLLTSDARITLSSYITDIENGLDIVELRKEKSIIGNADYESEESFSLTGEILVKDPDGENDTSYSANTPGIFILNTSDNTKKRIFSSNDNPWIVSGQNLSVNSSEIVVNRIVFDDTVEIIDKSAGDLTTTVSSTVITSFTHFSKIEVNGEEYQLCLTV